MQELNRVELDVAWNEETANPAVLKLLELIEPTFQEVSPT